MRQPYRAQHAFSNHLMGLITIACLEGLLVVPPSFNAARLRRAEAVEARGVIRRVRICETINAARQTGFSGLELRPSFGLRSSGFGI